MTISEVIRANVQQNPRITYVMGSRTATVEGLRHELLEVLGEPHQYDPDGLDDAAKVTTMWFFETPRGQVAVRDYWWNSRNEWSIATTNWKAALWVIAWFRRAGLRAYGGVQRYKDNPAPAPKKLTGA